ncbi:MAG: purine-nucleoside phosphorylase [Prevotellaceae bacterium]|nr:purine-nucleoside phosphorylase [Prevotellaceae bacterium]
MSKENVPTPHNAAKYGEIAETVIMSGDPLRAKFMAENFLENPVQFNDVRGMLGFTGTYKGKRVSVMGHGMGIPSIAIYTYELFNFYDVKNIIRVGTAGCIQPGMKLGDIVIAQGACTNSAYIEQFRLPGTFAPIADFGLLNKAVKTCEELGYGYKVGNVMSSDNFYDEYDGWKEWQRMGVLAVEMEASALYANAAKAGKHALAILTVSDSIVDGTATTAEERRTSFTRMMDVAFSLA